GDVLEGVGDLGAVEVGAEGYVLDADPVGDVAGVAGGAGGGGGGCGVSPGGATASIWASVRLRELGQSAWAPAWLTTSGAAPISAASQKPASFMWARSRTIPSSAQRRTRRLPAAVRPGPVSGVAEYLKRTPLPKALGRLQTGPTERRPAAYQRSSDSRSASIGSAPSRGRTPTGGLPSAAASMSATVRPRRISPARSSASRRPAAVVAAAAAKAWSSSGAGPAPPGRFDSRGL